MSKIRKFAALVGALAAVGGTLYAAPAAAQATRTWVSGVGDDANPCSRTAPCKTFAGAISKTAANGEINCIDPGGFGGVTITKAIAIQCDNVEAGVLVSGTNGIVINAGINDRVVLSGLDIHGVGTGTVGVNFIAGGQLIIQNSTIRLFNGGSALGVKFAPSGAAQLSIVDTLIAHNGFGATGGGIEIKPTGTGSAKVVLTRVNLLGNTNNGFRMDSTGNTGPRTTAVIEESTISGSAQGISVLTPNGTTAMQLMLEDSIVYANTGFGILADGAQTLLRVGNSTITANINGILAQNAAVISSYGDNRLNGNVTTEGTFTGAVLPKK